MNRNIKFDNLRGFSIILIVMGHFIGTTHFTQTYFDFTYTLIYLFDLPLLIFISGYFSKNTPESSIKAFRTVFIPYLIFNTFWIIFIFLTKGYVPADMYLVPGFGLWYLLSLYLWRAFLPTATKIKHIFVISFILAMLIGTVNIDPNLLSITRTICYFPVFLFGFYFKNLEEKFTMKKSYAVLILIPLLIGATLLYLPFNSTILILKYAYASLHMGNLKGMVFRLLFILISMIIIILLHNIMTSKKTFLTKVGKNSMSVYILQFYFVFTIPDIMNYLGFNYVFNSTILCIFYVIIATALVCFILSRDKVNEIMDILIIQVTKILMKKSTP